jgi:hypothetical protein
MRVIETFNIPLGALCATLITRKGFLDLGLPVLHSAKGMLEGFLFVRRRGTLQMHFQRRHEVGCSFADAAEIAFPKMAAWNLLAGGTQIGRHTALQQSANMISQFCEAPLLVAVGGSLQFLGQLFRQAAARFGPVKRIILSGQQKAILDHRLGEGVILLPLPGPLRCSDVACSNSRN